MRRRATVLSLAGVETEAEADGAGPPLSEGEPPPAPVDAELAGPPEGPAPETIPGGDRPELGAEAEGRNPSDATRGKKEWSLEGRREKQRQRPEPTRRARGRARRNGLDKIFTCSLDRLFGVLVHFMIWLKYQLSSKKTTDPSYCLSLQTFGLFEIVIYSEEIIFF